jgi:hypothetical protein
VACPHYDVFLQRCQPEARTLGGLHRRQTFCKNFCHEVSMQGVAWRSARPGLPRRMSLEADLDSEWKSSASPIKNAVSDRWCTASVLSVLLAFPASQFLKTLTMWSRSFWMALPISALHTIYNPIIWIRPLLPAQGA